MKNIILWLCLMISLGGTAQQISTNTPFFTINGQTYKVFGKNAIYVSNVNKLPIYEYENPQEPTYIKRIIFTTDCGYDDGSPIDMNDAYRKVKEASIKALGKRRYTEIGLNEGRAPDISLVVDHSCQVRDVGFALAPSTTITRQEIYKLELEFRQLVLKKNNPPCNFDYMIVNTGLTF